MYRIIVVGTGGVGKSKLTVRFINGTFVQRYMWDSIGPEDSYRKQVEVDGKSCIVDILDIVGQEEYSALRDSYIKTGDGFVLVYSITSQRSVGEARKLRATICRIKDESNDIPIMLVGNKCDLEGERVVSTEEGTRMAANWNTGFFESSAKANKNVHQIFFDLVRMIDNWREKHPEFEAKQKEERKRYFCRKSYE